jgi:heat shock protein HtpX
MMSLNALKTLFFLTILTLLFIAVGNLVAGQSGALIALVIAGVMNFVSYWFSDKIVLSMYGAEEIQYSDDPNLFNLVQRLANQAQLPMPRMYIIPAETPNAFATGRDPQHAAVAVTQGILRQLNSEELEGVIGHELGHVKHRDILISSVVATIAGAISYIATMAQWAAMFGGLGGRSSDDEDRGGNILSFLILAILAPILATLIQLAVSRSREFLADRTGAEISGKPLQLANALIKLENTNAMLPMESNNATAHMFIVSPLSGKGLAHLFRTHPSTEERVARLREYASANMTGFSN